MTTTNSKLTVREANHRAAGPQPFNVGEIVEVRIHGVPELVRIEDVKVFGIDWFALVAEQWVAAPYVKVRR